MNGITFNSNNFDKKTNKLIKQSFPDGLERALGVAMLDLLNDCIMEVPTVPLKEGWLRGSGSIFVNNVLAGTYTNNKDKFVNLDNNQGDNTGFVGVIGFNAPYAARLHEGINFKFTEPSSGSKFLESKLIGNRSKYMETIAVELKKKVL